MYDRLKKILPIVLIVIVVVFSILYFFIGRQYGVEYQDALYFPATEGDTTVYSAKVDGQPASFTIQGSTVTYNWGDTVYGPYTIRKDPTAAPGGEWSRSAPNGVEITLDGQLLFRGGYSSDCNLMVQEDGQVYSGLWELTYSVNGVTYDMDGNPVDPHKPSLSILLSFFQLPEPDAHRGNPIFWVLGLVCAGLAVVFIRFDDAIFRFNLSFRVKYPEDAEPSDWELLSRIFGWLLFTVLAFVSFMAGLIIIS